MSEDFINVIADNLFANTSQKELSAERIYEVAESIAPFVITAAKKDIIGKIRSILNNVAYKNNGLDVNGDYCEQPYVELDNEFRKLLKED